MKIQAGQTVLITGASGGLGVFIARAFAALKTNLALTSYPGTGLDDLRQETGRQGMKVMAMPYDLSDSAQRHQLIQEVTKQFGSVDILINNAGVEFTSAYHDLAEESLRQVLSVNLEAPMMLSRLLLPGMIERKRGHIVNISSLAGKSGPAYQEPYAATKAALIAFTTSLRATYSGAGVSASAIVPGFIEAGIYAHLKEKAGCPAPALLGSSPPQKVARAIIRAIERDLPEVIVNRLPVRPLLAISALFPRLGERVFNSLGGSKFFQKVIEAQKQHK